MVGFQLSDWQVHPALNRLQRGPDVVRLEPKVMQVLVRLAASGGDVVSRNELIHAVWPDVFVTDDVLHRAIGELRRALGDSSSDPRYIETIRKRGYRLMVPATPLTGVSPVETLPAAAPPGPHRSNARPPSLGTRSGWLFAIWACMATVAIGMAVFLVGSRSSELAPRASARFVPVVSGPLNESDPAMSPDGLRVAFVQREPGDTASADIFVRELRDGRLTRITSHPASDRMPAWSPDGRRLAFVRSESSSDCEVIVRPLASDAETAVAPCGNPYAPRLAWTRDGRGLLLAHRAEPHAQAGSRIARIDLETRNVNVVTQPPPGIVGDDTPAVSPDGRRVAFIRRMTGGVSDIYIVAIDGGTTRRVTFDDADLTGVDWAADGRSLVFSSDRAGGYSLWRVGIDRGVPVLLAGGAARMKHPVADRSGRRIVYENWNYAIDVWEVGLAGQDGAGLPAEAGTAVTHTSELWNLYPQVSPAGARVAYISTQSGAHELWVADRDGSNARQLTRIGRGMVKMPRWSPDGGRIAYVARGEGAIDVHVIDVVSGVATALTASDAAETAPAWSHDGTRVWFGVSDAEGRWSVWSVDAMSQGAEPRLEVRDAVAAQVSADGESVYFTRADQPGLWRRTSQDAATAARVIGDVPIGSTLTWHVTSRGIYFVQDVQGEVRLLFAPLAGTAATMVATLTQFSWPGFSITPDGTRVLYARWDRRESNLMSIEY